MAVNTIGQNIQLLLSPTQGSDITQGLQPGSVLQAKVMELLPDSRAIIQLKGMNLLADLPTAQVGQPIGKGSILDLAVLASTSSAQGSSIQAPALSLKLLGVNTGQTTALPQANNQALSSEISSRPSLENFLNLAQIPVTNANLQAAQSLSRSGLPLDKATLISVVQTADAMLAVENLNPPSQAAPAGSPQPLPVPIQNSLMEAKTLLTVLSNQPSGGADRPVLQGLIRQINSLLNQEPLPQVPPTNAPTTMAEPTVTTPSPKIIQSQIDAAVLQASSPVPGSLQGLQSALTTLVAALPQLAQEPAPIAAPTLSSPSSANEIEGAPLPSVLSPALQQSVTREVTAALVQNISMSISAGKPLDQQSLLQQIDDFASQVSKPQNSAADQIIQSAKNQVSEVATAPLQDPKAEVLEALSQIKDAFVSQPLERNLRSQTALTQAFESRDLPAPKVSLSSLPRESVLEAVSFLKARDLPTTRSLVETVATEFSQGKALGTSVHDIAQMETQLPDQVFAQQPQLKQAFQDLNQFLGDHGIQLEGKEVWSQLQTVVTKSGLNLESNLAQHASSQAAPDSNPGASLKSILLKLKDSVQRAAADPNAQADPANSDKLDHLNAQLSSAINTMHTLALSAKPTPAFDVSTVQLPVAIGGQLQNGQLSVYWKRGKPHELSAQDPVNVVFLLNTRGLGEVKAQLQVWKNECQCRVSVSSPESRDFIKGSLSELKAGFEANTRFKLNSLEVSANEAVGMALSRSLSLLETPDNLQSSASALNLTA